MMDRWGWRRLTLFFKIYFAKATSLLHMPSRDPQQLDMFAPDFSPSVSDHSAVTPLTPVHAKPKSLPPRPIAPRVPVSVSMPPMLETDPQRHLQLGPHTVSYALRRSKRRSIGFMIDDDGLRVTAPKWLGIGDIEQAIREKQRWILSKLHQRRERSAHRLEPKMLWIDGGALPYLGGHITLRLQATQTLGLCYQASSRELIVSLPAHATEQQLKDRVQGWLQLEAKRLFSERLPMYAAQLGVTYQSFALSSASTQWGSCTSQGKIRLNWKLIHFALPLIDYVIAHELAHLREMNHSPRFWDVVRSVVPDYQHTREVLKTDVLPVFD